MPRPGAVCTLVDEAGDAIPDIFGRPVEVVVVRPLAAGTVLVRDVGAAEGDCYEALTCRLRGAAAEGLDTDEGDETA